MELLEKAIKMAVYTNNWEIADQYLNNITWLFEKMDPEAEKYFGKENKENVQLPEN